MLYLSFPTTFLTILTFPLKGKEVVQVLEILLVVPLAVRVVRVVPNRASKDLGEKVMRHEGKIIPLDDWVIGRLVV